jgi:hypothetical protein
MRGRPIVTYSSFLGTNKKRKSIPAKAGMIFPYDKNKFKLRLSYFLFVPISSSTFFPFVSFNFLTFPFLAAGH